MENQLELIAKSYDRGIECGRNGINLYEKLPEYITNDPDYTAFQAGEANAPTSGRAEIKDYLSPEINMNFIDLGCCLNLMFRGYDKWLSTYHGVDISPKTIELLDEYVTKNKLSVGKLFCGSIHQTHFDDNYFDIGTCIGVLEYFDKDFVEKAIIEMHRIIKPNGKLVIAEIPDITNPACRIYMMVEEYLERPVKFNIPIQEFEDMLQTYFEIEKQQNDNIYRAYFLKCKK